MVKFFKVNVGWSSLEVGDVVECENESLKIISILSVETNRDGDIFVSGTGVSLVEYNK